MDPKTHIYPDFYTPHQVLNTMYPRNTLTRYRVLKKSSTNTHSHYLAPGENEKKKEKIEPYSQNLRKERQIGALEFSVRTEKMTSFFEVILLGFSIPPPCMALEKKVCACVFVCSPAPLLTQVINYLINLTQFIVLHLGQRISLDIQGCDLADYMIHSWLSNSVIT